MRISKDFFQHLDHEWIIRFIESKIKDPNITRLVRRMLKAGIMNDYQFEATEEGSGQGSVCSPVISCIYMHYRYVLVWWFKEVITPRLKGYGGLIAYADDFVVCFQYKSDAEWFYERLKHRMGYFGLSLEEEKSKNICQCIRLINVNDSFRKEPDAGKPQVRILRGAYDRKGCVYSTPYDFLKFPDKV